MLNGAAGPSSRNDGTESGANVQHEAASVRSGDVYERAASVARRYSRPLHSHVFGGRDGASTQLDANFIDKHADSCRRVPRERNSASDNV